MDNNNQMPRPADGFSNGNLFPADNNNAQFPHAYDNIFSNGPDQNFADASWAVNGYQAPSRATQASPVWHQNANHVSNLNAQPSPYARQVSQSPTQFPHNPYGQYNPQHQQTFQQYQTPQQQFDPALFNQSTSPPGFNANYASFANQPQNAATVTPDALGRSNAQYNRPPPSQPAHSPPVSVAPAVRPPVDQTKLVASIPKGDAAGLVSIINFEQLAQGTNSERMGNFVNIGKEPLEFAVNRTTTLPAFTARKSKNELRKLVGNDPVLLAKIGKKSLKKQSGLSSTKVKATSLSRPSNSSDAIKYEGDSSSDDDSSDDDASSYTSESDSEGSPLPSKRPTDPKELVEYDTIKALWRSKRKSLDSDNIRKGLVDFWDIVKTIRDRWKTDTAAVQDAEEKKRAGELPLLKSRVKDQRDMIELAFKTALKHGHRSIIELLGENVPLIFLCYQFLLDRFKEDDLNGALARAMLESITLFTTLTDEKLEKTHLVKVLPRYVKKGDAKTQFFAKRIIANAATGSKEKSSDAATNKPTGPGSPKRPDAEPVAGMKRSASNVAEGGVPKKVATSVKPNGPTTTAAKSNGVVKKQLPSSLAAKTGTTAPAAPTAAPAKPKTVVAKPSSFFASLQSATKKPGTSIKGNAAAATTTAAKPAEKKAPSAAPAAAPKSTFSFAETMANLAKPKEEPKPTPKQEATLPDETPEEKAKRIRKEARRKLRVEFKKGDELEQIKYFTHDPEEELGHDSSQMRDMSDVGGEGRMLKMHMMDIDEEDDDGSDDDEKLIDFRLPVPIDFSVVPADERSRMYSPYGGGDLQPDSPERTVRELYEANTLIVFYADPNDIPPNPREPADPYNGLQTTKVTPFGQSEDAKLKARLEQRKSNTIGGAATAFNQGPPQPAAPPALNPDLQRILASLQAVQPQAPQQQQQPQPQALPFSFPNIQPPTQQAQPTVDLAAIMASISGHAAPAPDTQAGGFNAGGASNFTTNPAQKRSFDDYRGNDVVNDQRASKPDFIPHNYKTRTCNYWRKGKCTKGDMCTFAHEEL